MEVFENAVFAFTCGRVKTEVFENADLAFTCGRVKTEVFENDDAIGACDCLDDLILLDNAHAPHRALSYFLRFCVYVWTGESDSNTLRVDTIFFKNGEKKLRFQKYPHTCGQGLSASVICTIFTTCMFQIVFKK